MLTSSYEFPTKGEGQGFPNPVDGWWKGTVQDQSFSITVTSSTFSALWVS